MGNARREDLQIKVPALLHLSRLGYGYLSRAELRQRDRSTNFFPGTMRAAVERINGIRMPDEVFGRLTEDLRAGLDADDLGERFYRTLRDGWNGIRLIDYAHPDRNLFQSAAEMDCGSGAGHFRPDITLLVNGIPLAMIEVKSGEHSGGLQAEYNRMRERIRSGAGRRYLQCAQVWAFSDDRAEDPDRLLPMEGAAFATAMTAGFPVYVARERRGGIPARLMPADPEEERRILADNGIRVRPRTKAFWRSPDKPTHRMLTALFYPARFLFLLRYGIQYIRETKPGEGEVLTRRMLTAGQLAVLESMIGKAARGYRNWTAPSRGAAGEKAANAALIALLRDLMPGAAPVWISPDEAEKRRDRAAFASCGATPALMTVEEALAAGSVESDPAGRRVFILTPPAPRYGERISVGARLRKAFPDAILVTRTQKQAQDGGTALRLQGR